MTSTTTMSSSTSSHHLEQIGGATSTPPGTPLSVQSSSSRRLKQHSSGLKSLSSLVQSAVNRGLHRKSSSLSSHHSILSSASLQQGYRSRLVLFSQWLSSSLESGECPPYAEVERRFHKVNVISADSLREL